MIMWNGEAWVRLSCITCDPAKAHHVQRAPQPRVNRLVKWADYRALLALFLDNVESRFLEARDIMILKTFPHTMWVGS